MNTLQYAAYGSNLHPDRLSDRAPTAKLLGTSFIAGHSLQFHKRSTDGSGKCNISTSGVAVYSIVDNEKPVLDKYEGLGKGYEEAIVDVPIFGRCFTYLATETHIDDSLSPYCWYKEMVRLGCAALDFPIDYVDAINEISVLEDPNEERRRKNWALVDQLRLEI